MSEPQNQGEGTPLKSTTQETSSPKIEITQVATENPTPGKEEQGTTPQASTGLPEAPAADEKTADSTNPLQEESGTTNEPSADLPMESTVESSTQPIVEKSTDETAPAAVAPGTGVAKPPKNPGLVQKVKDTLGRIFCCGSKDDVQS